MTYPIKQCLGSLAECVVQITCRFLSWYLPFGRVHYSKPLRNDSYAAAHCIAVQHNGLRSDKRELFTFGVGSLANIIH